jgi:hypothetical protein
VQVFVGVVVGVRTVGVAVAVLVLVDVRVGEWLGVADGVTVGLPLHAHVIDGVGVGVTVGESVTHRHPVHTKL